MHFILIRTHNNRMQRILGSDGELAYEGLYKPNSADTPRYVDMIRKILVTYDNR